MTPIQRLIAERRAELGLSHSDAARASGGRVTRQRFQQLETEPLKRSPEPRTVAGIAAALKLPLSVVKDAVSESIGLRVTRDENSPLRMLADQGEERLSPDEQETLARMWQATLDMLADRRR